MDTDISLKPFANKSVTPFTIQRQIIGKTKKLFEKKQPFNGLPTMTKEYENKTFADIEQGMF